MAGNDKPTTKLERILTHIKKNLVLIAGIVTVVGAILVNLEKIKAQFLPPEITTDMTDSLQVTNPENIDRILNTFVKCGDEAIPPILHRLQEVSQNSDAEQQQAIIWCLTRFDDDEVLEKTIAKTKELFERELRRNRSEELKIYAIKCFLFLLGDIGKNNTVSVLEELENGVDNSSIHEHYKVDIIHYLNLSKKSINQQNHQ